MKLYFSCPETRQHFACDEYSLLPGHQIIEQEQGGRKLLGIISLNSSCPHCGGKHSYPVSEVMCSLPGGEK